jgi:hypothetical protein
MRLNVSLADGFEVQNPSQRGPIITMIARKLQDTAGQRKVEKLTSFIAASIDLSPQRLWDFSKRRVKTKGSG